MNLMSVDYYASDTTSAPALLVRVIESSEGDETVEVLRDGYWVEDPQYFWDVYNGNLGPVTGERAEGIARGSAAA